MTSRLLPPGPHSGRLSGTVAFHHRRARIARLLGAEIQRRQGAKNPGTGVLGLILADEPRRTADHIVEELLALLMAAQEPMAATLTWLTLRASGSREASERLHDEDWHTPYAEGVVKETLRVHPAAVASLRELTAPMRIASNELSPGTTMMVPIPVLHRDPRNFSHPDRFLPERHLDGSGAERLMPFGDGARSCLGEHLAWAEIRAILPVIWSRLRFRLIGAQPERMVLRGTILVPQRSGLVMPCDL
jgi:cytochrome P450